MYYYNTYISLPDKNETKRFDEVRKSILSDYFNVYFRKILQFFKSIILTYFPTTLHSITFLFYDFYPFCFNYFDRVSTYDFRILTVIFNFRNVLNVLQSVFCV